MACGMKDSVLISVFQVIYSIPQEQADNLSLVFLKVLCGWDEKEEDVYWWTLIHCLLTNRMILSLGVGSFVCSVPGGSVERQVNTSLLIPRLSLKLKPESRACQTQKTKQKTGILLSVSTTGLLTLSQKASSPRCFFITVFTLPSLPLERALLLCGELAETPTCESFSWIAQTTWQSSSDVLGAFPLGLTSPTVRPPYSGGRGPEQHGTSDGFSESELRQNKRLYIFCICAKGTLTERWAIWQWKHRAQSQR